MVNSKKVQGAALPVPKKKKSYVQGQPMVDKTTMPVNKKQPPQPMVKEVMISSQGRGKPKLPVSRSARAGLQFPVGRWVSLCCRHMESMSLLAWPDYCNIRQA